MLLVQHNPICDVVPQSVVFEFIDQGVAVDDDAKNVDVWIPTNVLRIGQEKFQIQVTMMPALGNMVVFITLT